MVQTAWRRLKDKGEKEDPLCNASGPEPLYNRLTADRTRFQLPLHCVYCRFVHTRCVHCLPLTAMATPVLVRTVSARARTEEKGEQVKCAPTRMERGEGSVTASNNIRRRLPWATGAVKSSRQTPTNVLTSHEYFSYRNPNWILRVLTSCHAPIMNTNTTLNARETHKLMHRLAPGIRISWGKCTNFDWTVLHNGIGPGEVLILRILRS